MTPNPLLECEHSNLRWECEDCRAAWSPELKAFDAHVEEHGCGCCDRGCADLRHGEGHAYHGTAHCPEAQKLWEALPPHEQVVIG